MKHVELGAFSLAGGSSRINLTVTHMWKAQCILQLMYIAGEDAVLYISVIELYMILSHDCHMFLGSIKEVEDPPEQTKPLLVGLFHNFTSSSRLIKRLQSHFFF